MEQDCRWREAHDGQDRIRGIPLGQAYQRPGRRLREEQQPPGPTGGYRADRIRNGERSHQCLTCPGSRNGLLATELVANSANMTPRPTLGRRGVARLAALISRTPGHA